MTSRRHINEEEAIGILCNESQTGLEDYQRRSELSLGYDITLLQIERSEENISRILAGDKLLVRHWDGNAMIEAYSKIPTVCYDRVDVLSRKRLITNKLIKALEKRDVDFVNPLKFRRMSADKWKQYQFFSASGISLPETMEYSEESLEDILDKHSVVFVKRRKASGGKGQFVIRDQTRGMYTVQSSKDDSVVTLKGLRKVFNHLDDNSVGERSYIVQQGLDIDMHEGSVYDFRLVYHRGPLGNVSLTTAYMRIGIPDSEQANVSKGGQFHDPNVVYENPKEILSPLKKQADYIIKIIGNKFIAGEIGLDFLPISGGKRFMLCEVNSKPGSKAIEELCRWNPQDEMHQMNGVTPYEYTNDDRERWGLIRKDFRIKPIRYAEWLNRTNTLID